MHVYRSRLLLAAIFAVGLTASAAWAGGRGSGGKGSPCGAPSAPCKESCSDCGKPCQASNDSSAKACATKACQAEFCCEEDCCCDDECSCDAEGRKACGNRCRAGACGEGACCDEECCEGECCDPSADCCDEDGCCCDGWFGGNWFRGWFSNGNQSNYVNKNFSPGMKCEKFSPGKFPYQLGHIYGGAMGQPMGHHPAGCGPANCWGPPCGVMQAGAMQAGAAGCGCKCNCGDCQCNKDKQAACPAGGACGFDFNITCGPMGPGCGVSGPCCPAGYGPPHGAPNFVSAPVPPPPPPGCPAMGPHVGVFHKLADVMAENAALHARIEAKEDWADEQECLRAALTEARQEVVRLTAAQHSGGNKDQVLIEWIKSQAEASARKDEMLVEVVAAVVELHATKAEASGGQKLEAKIEKLVAALEQAKEENARLRTEVSQLKRETKRVSTSNDGACNRRGACRGDSSPVYKVQTEPVDCPK